MHRALSIKAMAFAIVAVGFTVSFGQHGPLPSPPEASPPLTRADWSSADLVCEIEGDVWAVDIDSKEPQKVLLIKNATNPSVRPGTRDIAFVRGDDIWLWSAPDGSEKKVAEGVLGAAYADGEPSFEGKLAWHPGGRWLAFSTCRPLTWQAEGRMPRACSYYDYLDAEWRRISWFGFLYLLDTKSGTCYELIGPDTDTLGDVLLGAEAPAWNPRGDRLAFVRGRDVWELGGFELPQEGKRDASWGGARTGAVADLWDFGQHGSRCSTGATDVCWTPDGDGTVACIHRLGGAGWGSAEVIPSVDAAGKACKLPGGRWLNRVLARLPDGYVDLALCADGKRVVYTTWEGLWLCESPSTKARLAIEGWVDCPSWIGVAHE